MAADRNQYNDLAQEDISTNSVLVRHWYGKLHIDKATHLARFFLDDIAVNVDANGVKGILGLCVIDGPNYNMHAPARRGCRMYMTALGPALAFRDGGLNIYAIASLSFGDLNPINGNLSIAIIVTSSFYSASTSTGLFNILDPEGAYVFPINVPRDETREINFAMPVTTGTSLNIGPFVVNEEGRKDWSLYSYTVPRARIMLYGPSDFASTAYNAFLIYGGSPLFTEVGDLAVKKLYTDLTGPSKPPAGFYANNTHWLQLDTDGVIVDMRAIGNWQESDPEFDRGWTAIHYYAFSAVDTSGTCNYITRPDWVHDPINDIIVYKSDDNGKIYTSSTLTTLAPDGFYWNSGGFPEAGIEQYVSGVLFAQGDCLNGLILV